MYQRLKRLLPIILWPFFMLAGWALAFRYKKSKNFVCFIGYPRSGHTLVGSMVNAHPNAIISIEANAFQLHQLGYHRSALFAFVEFWSKFVAFVLSNRWSGYSYKIEGGSQGKSQEIQIIGDNDANQTSKRVLGNSRLPNEIAKKVEIPVKYIHVIRNPFDVITTMHNRKVGNFDRDQMQTVGNEVDEAILEKKVRVFFRKANEVEKLIANQKIEAINIYHDQLILSPKNTLKKVVDFIGLRTDHEYLSYCASAIHSSSNRSRHKIEWPEHLKKEVESQCRQISFLKDYTFAT